MFPRIDDVIEQFAARGPAFCDGAYVLHLGAHHDLGAV
jgi:hypothetical protein